MTIEFKPPRTSKIKSTRELQELYERERRLDTDPEAPTLPPEMWEKAVIGKFYRPLKTAVSVRIDNDVLAWLKAQGDGHLTRINEILRQAMLARLKRLGSPEFYSADSDQSN